MSSLKQKIEEMAGDATVTDVSTTQQPMAWQGHEAD